MTVETPGTDQPPLVSFKGSWTEFLGIAIVNLVLTILTLGIYRCWAKAKERRYLWSRTTVMGDPLEYTGTGGELFLGMVIVVFGVLMPISLAFGFADSLRMAGHALEADALSILLWGLLLYLAGVGTYRAQRYLLSRTTWRGMVARGWGYGLRFLGCSVAGLLTLFLAMPWANTRLWNERWNEARFGSLEFRAEAPVRPLLRQFLPVWAGVVGLGLALFALSPGLRAFLDVMWSGEMVLPVDGEAVRNGARLVVFWYAAVAAGAFVYNVLCWRHIVSHTRLDRVPLRLNATLKDWLLFVLGNAALLVFTLGLGFIMLRYRVYAFALRHLEAEGALDPDAIAQSQLAVPMQGEGLADVFDFSPV